VVKEKKAEIEKQQKEKEIKQQEMAEKMRKEKAEEEAASMKKIMDLELLKAVPEATKFTLTGLASSVKCVKNFFLLH